MSAESSPADGPSVGSSPPRPRPQALVWDMDGTLVDSATVVPDSFIATVTALGGRSHDRDEVIALYSLGEPAVMLAHMLGRPATGEDVAAYHHDLERRAGTSGAIRAYPGIREALDSLRHRLPMAVFKGASTRAAQILLGAAGLAAFFDVVVGGDQIERPKPHPDGILRACDLLGVDAARSAYIGDAPTDLRAARSSGALALAAAWGHLYDPAAEADLTIADPRDLVGAVV